VVSKKRKGGDVDCVCVCVFGGFGEVVCGVVCVSF
jgi:hypothetical protein